MIKIKGTESLFRKLTELSGNIINAELETVVGKQINMIQAMAKLGCPVNDGELRNSIKTAVERSENMVTGICYTNKSYAPYVEMGTGPKGEANHAGISPDVSPAYVKKPWWIHESQIDKETAEKYHWFKLETKKGVFYLCSGQAAQPFMYPALRNNEKKAVHGISSHIKKKLREVTNNA